MLTSERYYRIHQLLLLLVTLCFSISLFAAQHQRTQAFEQGNKAYKEGNFEQALDYYNLARDQGRDSPNLSYNLGVTHYMLAQYESSRKYFNELAGMSSEWRDLAHYNLGLVAMKTGDKDSAEREFRLVLQTTDNERLRYLAGQAMEKIDLHINAMNTHPVKDWLLLLGLSGGYDDNAVAFPDLQQSVSSRGSDEFLEFMAYGQKHVLGDYRDGLRIHALAFTKRYMDLDVVDVSTFSGGITKINSISGWRFEYGLGAGYNEVNSDKLSSQLQGMFRLGRRLGDNEVSLLYKPAYHDGGANYAYLDGWQHKLDLRLRHRQAAWRLTVQYGLELNDREDLAEGETFSSFSPTRHSLLLQGDWYLGRDWRLTAGAEYTKSDYRGQNRQLDLDGEFKVESRDSDLLGMMLKAQYDLTLHWRVLGEYQYNNKDDTYLLYDYTRNEFKLSVEYSF